jgi:hypothetical protein
MSFSTSEKGVDTESDACPTESVHCCVSCPNKTGPEFAVSLLPVYSSHGHRDATGVERKRNSRRYLINCQKPLPLLSLTMPRSQPDDLQHHMHALTSQIGGHPGVMASDDSTVIVKPCLLLERQFYEAVNQDERYRSLLKMIPRFYGILKLEGRLDPEGSGIVVDIGGNDPAKTEPKDRLFTPAIVN